MQFRTKTAALLRRVGRTATADVRQDTSDLQQQVSGLQQQVSGLQQEMRHVCRVQQRPQPQNTITRATIADHYLRGRGLEIGALHNPLAVPAGTVVEYVDVAPADVLARRFPEAGQIREPDIIDDGETLSKIPDGTYDFVAANHFLEHTEDPFSTLKNFTRVLRPGGMIFMAVPDKRWTFDKPRKITPLDHLLRDYFDGPHVSRRDHYEEWLSVIDGYSGQELESKIEEFIKDRVNIHFHVWTIHEMAEMFHAARDRLGIDVEIQLAFADEPRLEVVWVLQRGP